MFFVLVQNEDGDLFKITVEHSQGQLQSVRIKYFDTVSLASSLCITKSGFLFVAAEMGNQYLVVFNAVAIYINFMHWEKMMRSLNGAALIWQQQIIHSGRILSQENWQILHLLMRWTVWIP